MLKQQISKVTSSFTTSHDPLWDITAPLRIYPDHDLISSLPCNLEVAIILRAIPTNLTVNIGIYKSWTRHRVSGTKMGTRLLANPAAPKNIRNLSGGKQFRPNRYTHLSTLYRCRQGLEFAPERLSSTKSNLAVSSAEKDDKVCSFRWVQCVLRLGQWLSATQFQSWKVLSWVNYSDTFVGLWVCGFVVAWQCGVIDLVDRRFMPQDTWLTLTNIAMISTAINHFSIQNVKCYQHSNKNDKVLIQRFKSICEWCHLN